MQEQTAASLEEASPGGYTKELPEERRPLPCFVRHPDAGGQCARPGAMEVYGLVFCEIHGEEVRLGMLMGAYEGASYFFERFRNLHVPDHNPLVDRELRSAVDLMNAEGPTDCEYARAIVRAYPEVPQEVSERVARLERDERASGCTAEDRFLDSLATAHKCMRVAFEDRETWLVETIEYQRESDAAQAACALRNHDVRPKADPAE